MMRTIPHWIDGREDTAATAGSSPVYNPATGQPQAEVLLADAGLIDRAVTSATAAFESWKDSPLSARTRIMFAFRDLVVQHSAELAEIISAEHGKVISDAAGEVARAVDVIEFACGIPHLLKGEFSDQVSNGIDCLTVHRPVGVCAGITPFNFPVMVPAWMHPVAIACGNSFILKPSERDPSVSTMIARLYQEAGLPDGVFTVVNGDRTAVDAICDHPGIAAVSFVGSTPIARYVHQRSSTAGKRVQALGGAKNHAIVLPDADLDFAADQISAAGYGSAGQRCMALSAVVAVGDCADDLVDRLEKRARSVVVGPGNAADAEMGPLVTAAARDRVRGAIDAGVAAGATLRVDGRGLVVAGHEDGFFVGPTLFDDVTTEMEIYTQEIFGPVLVVLRAPDLDSAIDLVNANPYGNGTAIFTSSGGAAREFARRITVGMVGINVPIPVPMAYHSFGGWKDSLFGDRHVHGVEGVSFYTRSQAITSRWPAAAAPVAAAPLSFPTAH
jgi:malonate-semialdehyde dehydrogenase (acetylating)/methylmalonate-semialdehyde dehydrogenase